MICRRSTCVILTSLGLLFLATPAHAQNYQGKLSNDQPKQIHKVTLSKGTIYQIDMNSGDFDAFLRIQNAGGAELAHDDDGGNRRNARLNFIPKETGEYGIVADSFGGKGRGDYTISFRKLSVVKVGQNITGKVAAGAPQYQDYPYDSYVVELIAGKTYKVDLKSTDFDALLGIRFATSSKWADFDDDSGGNLNSRLIFTAKQSGTHELFCGSLNKLPGSFTLTIVESN